jgi:hypothetical protein
VMSSPSQCVEDTIGKSTDAVMRRLGGKETRSIRA